MSTELSKKIVKILRHDVHSCGLNMTADGFVDVDELLGVSRLSRYTTDDVRKVVQNDSKKRYVLRNNPKLQIKATQGHTVDVPDLSLEPINHYTDERCVLHGTKESLIQKILAEGLCKMRRDHIHFAAGVNVLSGFPGGADVVIEIDLRRALNDGLKFYKSENGVILSKGDCNGRIHKKYFKRVYKRSTGEDIYPK